MTKVEGILMNRQEQVKKLQSDWADSPRWKGITRNYSAEDVVKLRGTVQIEYTLARHGAEKLWRYVNQEEPLCALGALTGNQAIQEIQAGLRAHGTLSIVDYPGFENSEAPDLETYSKALNGGQYPLSVLAVSGRAAELYRPGIYGNTMTSNPRAMDVAVAVLESLNDSLRNNICERGRDLVAGLAALIDDANGAVLSAQGTGLLVSCELDQRYKIYGTDSTEDYLRRIGLSVIHGGERSLRYTPVFGIGAKEVELIVNLTRQALLEGPTHQ